MPARNEEASLSDCLRSLVRQSGPAFEIIVVDDHSTDRTREIAQSFQQEGVRVVQAPPLPAGWTGKNNAVTAGARQAQGEWLLFTDADTVHIPGSIARALAEAQKHNVEMLSYSPEQIAVTFWEMATLPVVFAELARQYPPSVVSDPASPIAAANGQFILIRRDTYEAVGGHAAIASEILEDVALARGVKRSGRKIRFRYAPEAVRTRMYRNYRQLRDGWTKNLALLFPSPGWLAAKTLFNWTLPGLLLFSPLILILVAIWSRRVAPLTGLHDWLLKLARIATHWWWMVIVSLLLGRNFDRLRRANFNLAMEWLGAIFGMPMFAYLLLRSKRAHAHGNVFWKGRTYLEKPGSDKPALSNLESDGKTLLASSN